jgi:hypothetical protein
VSPLQIYIMLSTFPLRPIQVKLQGACMLKDLFRSMWFVRTALLIAALALLVVGLLSGEPELTRIESGTL